MPDNPLPRNKKLRPHSTELRNNATKEEKHLWYDFLRKYSVRFNRQRIIGNYIVDFYCPKIKLVIELDGSQHYKNEEIEYDNTRSAYFAALGIEVIRFPNAEVDNNFEGVCASIDITAQRLLLKGAVGEAD